MMLEGFPGHSVKNLPASERDTGSIPDLGRPPNASQQLGWRATAMYCRAQEPQLLKPRHPRVCVLQQEKPLQ